MSENSKEIEKKIKETLKLNKYETNAYMALIKLGKSRPVEIAKESNIPVQRIYDVLRSLHKKGLITTKDETYYEIVDPYKSFQAIAQSLIADASIKAREIENLGTILSKLTSSKAIDEIKIVYGIKDSIGNTIATIKACDEKPYFMVYKVLDKLVDLWPLLYELISSTKNGATLLIPYDSKIDKKYLEESEKHNFNIIKSKLVYMDLFVGCDTVIIGLPSSSYEVISIVINNKEFASALKNRIEEVMNKL